MACAPRSGVGWMSGANVGEFETDQPIIPFPGWDFFDDEDVADLDPLGVDPETLVRDVAVDHPLPDLLLSDRELAAAFTRSESTRRHDIEAMLRRTDVSSARAGHTDEVVPMIVKMLERRRRGR